MLRESRPILAAVVAICAFTAVADAQTIWYVSAANCPGPGDGSPGNPFCKIQIAITAAAANASPPDEIVVADGIYTGTGNKDLDFGGKIIKLRSENGPANCIIDCEGSGRGSTSIPARHPLRWYEDLRYATAMRGPPIALVRAAACTALPPARH
jgi:hypothetical protein